MSFWFSYIKSIHHRLDNLVRPVILQPNAGLPQQADRGGGPGEDNEGVAGPGHSSDKKLSIILILQELEYYLPDSGEEQVATN